MTRPRFASLRSLSDRDAIPLASDALLLSTLSDLDALPLNPEGRTLRARILRELETRNLSPAE